MNDEGMWGTFITLVLLTVIITLGVGLTKSNVLDKQVEWERQQTLRHCLSAGHAPAACKAMVAGGL